MSIRSSLERQIADIEKRPYKVRLTDAARLARKKDFSESEFYRSIVRRAERGSEFARKQLIVHESKGGSL